MVGVLAARRRDKVERLDSKGSNGEVALLRYLWAVNRVDCQCAIVIPSSMPHRSMCYSSVMVGVGEMVVL